MIFMPLPLLSEEFHTAGGTIRFTLVAVWRVTRKGADWEGPG